MIRFTKHALRRWSERFPSLDLYAEYENAERVGKRRRKKLRQLCPGHSHLLKGFKGFYYRLGRNGVLFVVTPPETIVTVFEFRESK